MQGFPQDDTSKGMGAGVRRLWNAALDFVYPPACPLCGGEDGIHSSATIGLCAACRKKLLPDEASRCVRCAAPVGPLLDTSHGCPLCRGQRFGFEAVIRLGVYDRLLRHACLRMKLGADRVLTAGLAHFLWEAEAEAFRAAKIDCVVPVPHHWTDWARGRWNAAETIGALLARSLRVEFGSSILCKVRRTPAQSRLPPTRRRANLRGAFRARGRFPSGTAVLLVDDILTTGTTAHETARVLRGAGAERVIVAVLARGIGRS